ncbi:MAG TPA: DUF3465 domain-containing protein [Candidatus Obscuribacterales bacterium]
MAYPEHSSEISPVTNFKQHSHMRNFELKGALMLAVVLAALLGTSILTACAQREALVGQADERPAAGPFGRSRLADDAASLAIDDSEAIRAQQNQLVKAQITVQAPVKKLLPDDTRGIQHQKFLISLSNGTTVLVAHNTGMAPRVPINAGDVVRIHGEFIWNKKGGLIHWTHHSDTPRHSSGWIEFNGQRYE